MSNDSSSSQILASNARGWCVFQHSDGRLQLDFGSIGMMLDYGQFLALENLVTAAQYSSNQASSGKLATDGPTRSIYTCNHHNIFILIFDQSVLRFCPADFIGLAQLCRQVAQMLPEISLEATVDYFQNRIRPALSLN